MMKRSGRALWAAVMYILAVCGIWMFLSAYTNSYNRLTDEKIVPAVLTVTGDSAQLTVIGRSCVIPLDGISSHSRLYFLLYLICPDELRAETAAVTAIKKAI